MARQMTQPVYDDDGVPKRGTKFATIDDALQIGRELARRIIEPTVDEQAGRVPSRHRKSGACPSA